MKKLEFLSWVSILFFITIFSSCDDEIIEGEFQETVPCPDKADIGKMRALIDTLDYHVEIGQSSLIVHDNGFHHFYINVSDPVHGDFFVNINDPEIGVFDLKTPNEMGPTPTNFNHHEGLTSFGVYNTLISEDEVFNPYVTFIDNGGFGEFEITKLDYEEEVFSGTFSFSGKRLKKDIETGELILDENGVTIIESIEISCGFINDAPFELSFGGNQSPVFNEFYAEVDGDEFVESSVTVQNVIVSDSTIIYITAIGPSGTLLRIDIPLSLELGTHTFEPISDGTKLTALYNNGGTSEGLTPNPGTITITEFDKIRGVIDATFSFTATDPFGLDPTVVEVRNGDFKVSFTGTSDTAFFLAADVDGDIYRSNTITSTTSTVFGVNIITISTTGQLNRSMDLIFPRNIEVGSYDMSSNVLTGNENVGIYTPQSGNLTGFRSNPGTLTILRYNELTGEIEGTFEFVAKDILELDPTEYEITNGTFVIRII